MPPTLERAAGARPLSAVARLIGVNPATVWRWCRFGVQVDPSKPRVFLETVMFPGGHRATEEALERFLEALNANRQRAEPTPPPSRKPAVRPEAVRANASAEAAGW